MLKMAETEQRTLMGGRKVKKYKCTQCGYLSDSKFGWRVHCTSNHLPELNKGLCGPKVVKVKE